MSKAPEPVGTITINQSDGSSREVPIQAPGGAVRFALGDAAAYPSVWRLWSSKTDADLYLATRDERHGTDSKYSFHASGDWRLAYDPAAAAALGVDRVLSQWERPAVNADGLIPVTRILTPSDDIVPRARPYAAAAKVTWLTPAPVGSVNALVIAIARPGKVTLPADAPLVAALALADRSLALVLHATGPADAITLDMFDQIRRHTHDTVPPPGAPTTYTPRADPEYRCHADVHEGAPDGPSLIFDLMM
ncbi:hypothetical protein [Demequina aestuarii]|uniref:hypothetical protein n=1 Tax=Demequina aestuarii TaxID=327095 RepID=UPI0007851B8F|nr:hypothetical protein [Demequina aestuarii]